MIKKILKFSLIILSLNSLGFSEIIELEPSKNTDIIKEEVKPINMIVKVKLGYNNPKIIEENGIYYVNNKPYRGIVYKKGNDVVNEIELEEYLYSVVSSEISVSAGEEALKAQSVAARTYALFSILNNKNKDFDLYDSVTSQVYKGMSVEKEKAIEAVEKTRGEIATYNNNPILAMYHSSSGSSTRSSEEVFGRYYPYLISVEDYTKSRTWEYKIGKNSLEKKMKKNYNEILKMKKSEIRKILGYNIIKSNNFELNLTDGYVYINGEGYGHGVGLSQIGAEYLAKEKKYTYKEILKHYYKDIEIEQMGDIK